MRHSRQIKAAMETLSRELAGWKIPKSSKEITFTPPSLLTEDTYAGIPLRSLMIPYVPSDPFQPAEIFTKMVCGETVSYPLTMKSFINNNPARVLMWAAQSPNTDIDLSLAENRLMVIGEQAFGFADGLAYGLHGGTVYPVNLQDLLEPKPYSTREVGFAALWRRAQKLKLNGAMAALASLRAYRSGTWKSIARWTWGGSDESFLTKLGEVIYTSADPIADLYAYTVPRILTRSGFIKKFGPLEERQVLFDSEGRVALWRNVTKLFL